MLLAKPDNVPRSLHCAAATQCCCLFTSKTHRKPVPFQRHTSLTMSECHQFQNTAITGTLYQHMSFTIISESISSYTLIFLEKQEVSVLTSPLQSQQSRNLYIVIQITGTLRQHIISVQPE